MTTTSKYFKSEEITNVRETLCTLISDLYNAAVFTNEDGDNQVVLQLNPEKSGEQWKMFVYYSKERETFYYSYQNEEYEDTLFTDCKGMLKMIEKMEEEIANVRGFEWVELDID